MGAYSRLGANSNNYGIFFPVCIPVMFSFTLMESCSLFTSPRVAKFIIT